MKLVIVESPTKAKTIRKFLGKDYAVMASMGHVRDLPKSSAEIPAEVKKTSWGNLGVNVDHGFEPLYVVPKTKTKTIQEMKRALKEADELYLATDEDREGESISWHLLQLLKPRVPVRRMVFHEITRSAIDAALSQPRQIDENLVRAQETRRILDRLVGYAVSPVLWKKIAYGLSAGRVQSVALKAIADRERQRMLFVKGAYWDVLAHLEQERIVFEAKLISVRGQRIASGKDFDETTGTLKTEGRSAILLDEPQAQRIAAEVVGASWKIDEVNEKPTTRRPPPPFITSTLQQESNRKLGLSSKETMRVAQSLYEQGHITYMRTDSVALSQEALAAVRQLIQRRYGNDCLPAAARLYASTSKGAQEAHEAIRPSLTFAAPDAIGLTGAERSLYELIWMRTLASQMADCQELHVAAQFSAIDAIFQANGVKVVFPGFLRAYVEGREDPEQALDEHDRVLPPLTPGDAIGCRDANALSHETKPPARFTEAGLIQFMEKEGIGRPSTYATIISTLIDRGYARKVSSALVPTFTGLVVTQLLENYFQELVDAGFTSRMEESLDAIAEGKQPWLPYLENFYRGEHGLERQINTQLSAIDPEQARQFHLPKLPDVHIHVGKYGPYFETKHPKNQTLTKASIPEDVAPADFTPEYVEALLSRTQQGPTSLGIDPASGKNMYLKTGSYGPYLQLGEEDETGKTAKPKRVSIPKNVALASLNAQQAAAILSLPRLLGVDPADGKEIRAGLGRFGPYLSRNGEFRSLKKDDDVLTVGLARALELFAQPKGGRGQQKLLRQIGLHPKDQKPISLYEGKFGAYLAHGTLKASLPKTEQPDLLTLERAVELLAAKKTAKKTRR